MEGIKMKRRLLLFAQVILTVSFGISSLLYAGDFKTITDMDDNIIEVPINPKRIACMHGVSSNRIITLGKGDALVLMMEPTDWALRLFPEIKEVQTVKPPYTGNVERMLSLNVDLVLYSPYPGEAEKYKAAGIKTACGFSVQKRPRTVDEFMENFKRQVTFFGDLLGPNAKTRADKYNEYFDEKMNKILSITSKIAKDDRPDVYYGGRSGNLLYSQGKASVMNWFTEVSGGNYLPESQDNNFTEINMEKVWAWDPDIILISGQNGDLDNIKENPTWASLKAVKNNRIYLIPTGVFPWDFASSESVILAVYLAKIFHPDLFKDWDMIREMKQFYSELYGRDLTDKDAERILKCLPPL